MLHVLRRLHFLWALILFLSTTVLIATVVLLSLSLDNLPAMILFTPLIASLITIFLFAYGIWGKTNPYLMPTSSPRSNPCTRSVRHFGTSMLSSLWVVSSVMLFTTQGSTGRLLAGLILLILIMVIIESIASNRIGKEQRRVLKEEERKLALLRATAVSGSTLVGGGGSSLWKSKKHGNNGRRDSGLGSLDKNDSNSINNTDTSLTTIEIVRPEAIDPATVIYNQQVLFESAQRQYHQQYHQYFFHKSKGTGSGGGSGSNDGHSGQQQLEAKYDDILLESSYKFEVPMDDPVSHDTSGPSTPPLSSWASKEILHLPSAPPAPPVPIHSYPYSHSPNTSYTVPPKAPQGPSTAATSSSPSSSYLSSPSTPPPTKTQQQRTSLLKCDISSVEIQIMTETNPFRDQDYRNATDLSASAPPYEPSFPSCSSSLSVPTVAIAVPELPKFEGQNRHVGSSSTPFEDHEHHHHSNNVYNSNNSSNHSNETMPTTTATTSTTNTDIILGVKHNKS